MKDATSELRKSYLTLLSNITLDGEKVPVYDYEVNDTVAPYSRLSPPLKYIIISNQNFADQSPKCKWDARHSIQVDSIATFPAYEGNSLTPERINNEVCELILNRLDGKINVNGFHCYSGRVDLSRNQVESTKTQNIFKRITIFNHSIEEI